VPPRAHSAFYLLIALLALCAGGKAILFDTLDPDCFWHLRVAEQLRQDGIGPLVDRLSFASVKEPWTPYSWLAELWMKVIWDAGGYRAAVLVHALMAAAFAVLLAMTAGTSRNAGPPSEPSEPSKLAIIVSTTFALYLSLPYLSFRPATLALCLLALAYHVLHRDRARPSRRVFALIPLTAVLANVHLYAFLVPLWVAGMLIGEAIEARIPLRSSAELATALPPFRRRITLLVATALAACATPMLPGVLRAALHYQFADPMVAGPVISEMRPIWQGPLGSFTVAILLAFLACILHGCRALRPADWLLLAGSTALLLLHGRYAPLFAIVAAHLLARTMPRLSDAILCKPALHVALAIIVLTATVRLVVAFPARSTTLAQWLNRHGPDTPGYPTAAAEFIESRPLRRTGRLITEFTWGGYLGWRLAGQDYQVLVDGRTQVFSPNFWAATYLGPADCLPSFLLIQRADAAVLPRANSRFKPALQALGWQVVYADERAEVMTPPGHVARPAVDTVVTRVDPAR
jgi:hypothetical protein